MTRQQSANGRMDEELQRLEQEIAGEESGLWREVARIAEEVESVRARLAQTRQNAANAARLGSDPTLEAIQKRASVELPPMQTEPAHERLRAARRAAVELRRKAVIETRSELQRFAEGLAQLARQLEADESALQQIEQRRREEEERLRQEEERRKAREEAMPIAPPAWDVDKAPPSELVPKAPPAPPTPPPPTPAAKAPAPGQSIRVQRRVKMQATVDLESESNFFQGFSTSISEGGIFVATVNTLPLGTQVDVGFTLPSGRRLEVQGEVRWTREVNDRTPDIFPGVGIQFRDLPPDAEAAIQQFVKTREPLFFPD